ncbi:hypothetical protein PMAYCL1PPCAC_27705 [Pristionchus mayeri]|uniref:Uncharacterized protein n=1 Tax=Pristionchus mayeri TaxID=1317129 RepID=A0AAN5IAX8_9BILA|nr:hypothetical protein PMAYCL1PPCAC_27705 [Pristionchus mayeri]
MSKEFDPLVIFDQIAIQKRMKLYKKNKNDTDVLPYVEYVFLDNQKNKHEINILSPLELRRIAHTNNQS